MTDRNGPQPPYGYESNDQVPSGPEGPPQPAPHNLNGHPRASRPLPRLVRVLASATHIVTIPVWPVVEEETHSADH